jgi:hypothetical protein
MRIIKTLLAPAAALVLIGVCAGLGLAAYKGHHEKDMPVMLQAYPDIAGTALDDCAVCHKRGPAPVPGDPAKRSAQVTACDYCHADMLAKGLDARGTLNSYGQAYLDAGRSEQALRGLESADSDGDGASNAQEIKDRTLPGDADDNKAAPTAPQRTLLLQDLQKRLPAYKVPLFMNVSKSPDGDRYDDLEGFLLLDVLIAAGMADNAESVDVISVDGYAKTFSIDQLRQMYEQAAPVFGLGEADLGACGWVQYNASRLVADEPLPLAGVMLSYAMNGAPYDPAALDPETGKLRGSGPFRSVAPQMRSPGPPDMSSRADAACLDVVPQVYYYKKNEYEKNSDYCVKAVVALRVNPLPAGARAPHWQPGAMKNISEQSIIVFGALNNAD